MKNIAIIAMVLVGLLVGFGVAHADDVAFDFDGLWSWGTSYTETAGVWNASNPNPYFGTTSQPLPNATITAPDGTEDTYGIARINTIKDTTTATTTFDRTTASTQLTAFFYGFDDIYIKDTSLTPLQPSTALLSTGGHLVIYQDTLKDYDPATPPDADTDRYDITAGEGDGMNKITHGTVVLDLVPTALQFDATHDFTMHESFSFSTFIGTGDMYLDVVGGDWASLYDTNSIVTGDSVNPLADIRLGFSSEPAIPTSPGELSRNWLVQGTGQGQTTSNVVPEPMSMLMVMMGVMGVGLTQRKRKKTV